ncbi:hypothetical protein HQ533_01855 [Candidatus Woesearchaeota archaeon]|nr:hypothetical protein [Candidatus Woesearchaeota archaeon]
MVNETIPTLIEPVVNMIGSAMNLLKTAIGGIFGLYVLLVILRWKEARDMKRILLEVKNQIEKLNKTVSKIERFEEKKKPNRSPRKP